MSTKPQTFRTRRAARAEIARMRGWDARPVKMLMADGSSQWVIECREIGSHSDPQYLRRDGYIR